MKSKLKAAVIGCGMIAKSAHIPAYKEFAELYDLAAVCDVSVDAAKQTAERFSVPFYFSDAAEMLEKVRPDVVSVCVPNTLHKEYVLLALNHGANVICEKPLGFKLSDVNEMYKTAEANGKQLMACQSLRFLPERLAAKRLVDEGRVGEVYYAEVSRIRRRGIPTWGKFHIKEASGGGAFLDIGVHGIDSAVWLMGNPKPVSVSAAMSRFHADELGSTHSAGALKGGVSSAGFDPEDMNVESFSSGTVRFENGATLAFKVAWASNLRDENNIIISGKKAGVDLSLKTVYSGENTDTELEVTPNGFETDPFYGHHPIIENMARVILGEAEPIVRKQETVNVTAIIEAAYRSAELKREVFCSEL